MEVDERTTSGDRDALRVARLAIRLAQRLLKLKRWSRQPTESIELALSFSRLAAALRLSNRLDHAERALEIAFDTAPTYLKGDLHRRRAWLRMYQLRLPEALQEALTAEELTIDQEHALALGALGAAYYYCGKHEAAKDRLAACLKELKPDNERQYCGMISSYISALSKGTLKDVEEALRLCPQLRSRLKDRHKMQRAKLWWVEGLMKDRLGGSKAAWWALDVARRSLIGMKAVPEVGAIVADMARISLQPPAVLHICDEAAQVIHSRHALAEPLEALACAGPEMIPDAAAALRQAANLITPCPSL